VRNEAPNGAFRGVSRCTALRGRITDYRYWTPSGHSSDSTTTRATMPSASPTATNPVLTAEWDACLVQNGDRLVA
jgi:hypothetical protein